MTRRLALAAAGCAALSGLSAWAGWWKFAALTLLVGVLCSAIVWMIVGRPQSPPSISGDLEAARAEQPTGLDLATAPPSYADVPRSYGEHLDGANPLPPWLIAQFEAGLGHGRPRWDPTGSLCLASLRSLLAVVPPPGWDHPISIYAPDMARHLTMAPPTSLPAADPARAITGGPS